MPATRRSRTSGGPATKGAQSTLSFGGRPKVTKATTTAASKLSKEVQEPVKAEIVVPEPEDAKEDLGPIASEAVVEQPAPIELVQPKSAAEERAEQVTDAQVTKYWRAREAERKAPRVHQEDLDVEEKVLRLFDMSSQYGPCIGIARMKRWVRANKLGLSPPIEVLAVLLKAEKAGDHTTERAHVDELLSSKSLSGGA